MKILVIAGQDSNNLMITNVLHEFERRGHTLEIYALHMDHKSIRMFAALKCQVNSTAKLTQSIVDSCDVIFSALRSHLFIGKFTFAHKYIFMYNHYIDNHWMTAGGDFMFTSATGRKLTCHEDCASMAVGSPANDHIEYREKKVSKRQFLFIDSGHYPFSRIGKEQVAQMLLSICATFPDYNLVVKPRFLIADNKSILHKNYDHLYNTINKISNFELPKNLILLDEHLDLQSLIDESETAIMLCTGAYVDTALLGKRMIIVKGIDNEDKFELRNDIEYKDMYALREESGCVVNYKDVLNYLPDGIRCDETHLKRIVAYRKDVSSKIADVVQYIYDKYLIKGLFPAIKEYDFETYQQDMLADATLSFEVLKHKRMKNQALNACNEFNNVIADIDYSEYYRVVEERYMFYPATNDGRDEFLAEMKQVRLNIWLQNADKMMKDPLDQAWLLKCLHESGNLFEILMIPTEEILCPGPYNFYLGRLFFRQREYDRCVKNYAAFLLEANERSFEKYIQERPSGLRTAYSDLINRYDGENLPPAIMKQLYEGLYAKGNSEILPARVLKRFNSLLSELAEKFYEAGDYQAAADCEHWYWERYLLPQISHEKRIIGAAKREITSIKHSLSYCLGAVITWIPRNIVNAFLRIRKKGIRKAFRMIANKFGTKIRNMNFAKIYNEYKKTILPGYQQYAKLVKKYGDQAYFEVGAGGTGDVYIAGFYYNEYIKKRNRMESAVFVVPGASCYQTLELFQIEKKEKLTKDEWNSLLHLYRFMGEPAIKMDILYYHIFTIYPGMLTWLEGFRDWNLYTLMHGVHFSDINIDSIETPVFNEDIGHVDELFQANGLTPGKTVLLCPYAKWPPKLPIAFWTELAGRLRQSGFDVCTNSIGEEEPVIAGTTGIFFSYRDAVPFLERAGYLISLRSGFNDITERADCFKVVFYPHNCAKRGLASENALGSFSLNAMFRRNDFLEYVTTPDNLHEVIEDIVDKFTTSIK